MIRKANGAATSPPKPDSGITTEIAYRAGSPVPAGPHAAHSDESAYFET